MPTKSSKTQWTRDVEKMVRRFAGAGIRQAPATKLFPQGQHVAIRAEGLDGIGIIHKGRPQEPFCFCVFEPSDREPEGFAEIFERTMASLDELPKRIEEWRAFRSKTEDPQRTAGLVEHRKWLSAVAKDKKKSLEALQESARLRRAGDIKGAWKAAGFDVKVKRPLPSATPAIAKKRLLEDLDNIAPDLLAWNLPRDDKGKWLLGRRVPLFRYDTDKRRMSAFCLVVAVPEKRSGRPEIRAEWLQADVQTARLDAVPEMFDTRRTKEFARELLGVESPKARALWSLKGLAKAAAAQVVPLQHEGQFEEAGRIAGVELDGLLLECMRGRRVAHMCTCCAPLDRQLIEWSVMLKKALTTLNFARVAGLALRDQVQCQRSPRKAPIPILPFPLQRHTRKAHLALDLRNPERPRLTIDTTGSGNRLPLALWKRPVDIDLLREGLLEAGDLPDDVAVQLGIRP